METLTLGMENSFSDIYLSLGLKKLGKRALRNPRVLSLLSSLLERSVQRNETHSALSQMKDIATIFHGLRVPTLSIQQYTDRIFKYSGCSPSCFVVAHIYIDRFIDCTDCHLTSLNAHRLLITSIMLAAKFMDDVVYNNAYYARVGGISTAELNKLEMKFLFSIDFRLQVNVETFERYCLQLEREGAEGVQIERLIKGCGVKESWSKTDESVCAPAAAT